MTPDVAQLKQAFVEKFHGHLWTKVEMLRALDALLAQERERCEKIAERHATCVRQEGAHENCLCGLNIAAAIRAGKGAR